MPTFSHTHTHTHTHRTHVHTLALVRTVTCTALTLDFCSSGQFAAREIAVLFWQTQQRSLIGFMMMMLGRSWHQSWVNIEYATVLMEFVAAANLKVQIPQRMPSCTWRKKFDIGIFATSHTSRQHGTCVCNVSPFHVERCMLHVHVCMAVCMYSCSHSLRISHSLFPSLPFSIHIHTSIVHDELHDILNLLQRQSKALPLSCYHGLRLQLHPLRSWLWWP